MDGGRVLAWSLALVVSAALVAACRGGGSDQPPQASATPSDAGSGAGPGRQFEHPQGVALRAPSFGGDGLFPPFADGTGSGAYGQGAYTLTARSPYSTSDVGFGREDLGPSSHVVAEIDSGASRSDTGFGIVCRLHDDGASYYRFGVGNDGTYSIAKVVANEDTILTGGGEWVRSSGIDPNSRTWQVGADCDGEVLTLRVNGAVVDQVQDDAFDAGQVGVFVETFDEPNASIAVRSFSAVGYPDARAVGAAARAVWEKWVADLPPETTRCELGDAAATGTRPTPIFAANCDGVLYLQVEKATETEGVFDHLVKAFGVTLASVGDDRPDCRVQSDVIGNNFGKVGKNDVLPGGLACIDDGDSIVVVWHDDTGLVGVLRTRADDPEFVRGWAKDWWPFRVRPAQL